MFSLVQMWGIWGNGPCLPHSYYSMPWVLPALQSFPCVPLHLYKSPRWNGGEERTGGCEQACLLSTCPLPAFWATQVSSSFCPSPPHAARPVSWRYWSLPQPAGRRRTLGDLYAISWRQGAYLGVFLPIRCSEPDPASACIPLLQDCLCLLHVKNGDLVCTMCVSACMFGRREPGVFLDLGP